MRILCKCFSKFTSGERFINYSSLPSKRNYISPNRPLAKCVGGLFIRSPRRTKSLSNYTKGALLYGVPPVCALCETEQPRHLNVWAVFRRYASEQGAAPLTPLCGYPCTLGEQTQFSKPHLFSMSYIHIS